MTLGITARRKSNWTVGARGTQGGKQLDFPLVEPLREGPSTKSKGPIDSANNDVGFQPMSSFPRKPVESARDSWATSPITSALGSMDMANEKHYSIIEISKLWALSQKTVRKIFENEPGVILWGTEETRHKRGYRTLRVPETVLQRVHRKLSACKLDVRGRMNWDPPTHHPHNVRRSTEPTSGLSGWCLVRPAGNRPSQADVCGKLILSSFHPWCVMLLRNLHALMSKQDRDLL